MSMRGLFVTGTDTGVGKSVLSAALIAAMVAAGETVRAYKPVVTGLDEPQERRDGVLWPPDHELLASVAGMTPEEVSPLRFGPAVSPHLAAELAGVRVEPAELLAYAHGRGARAGAAAGTEILVVEGVGGLLAPLADHYTVRDLAVDIGLPMVIAARPGLGTINHTLLTLEAARSVDLDVRAVVLTPWPEQPGALESSNRATIARLGEVEVQTLDALKNRGADTDTLTHAGESLLWSDWLTCA
jgi:dethiobiotin synthetase